MDDLESLEPQFEPRTRSQRVIFPDGHIPSTQTAVAEDSAFIEAILSTEIQRAKITPLSILVVDDVETERVFMERQLQVLSEEFGIDFDICTVSGGKAALEALSDVNSRYRVVIIDAQMPDMHGLDVIESLASLPSGHSRKPPFVLLRTGGIHPNFEEKLVQLYVSGAVHAVLHKEDRRGLEAFRAALNLFSLSPENHSVLRTNAVEFLRDHTRAALLKMGIDTIGHEEAC